MRGERSLLLSSSVRIVFHTAILFSLFLLFAGHNAPGGGFIGGLVAGAALVLLYVDRGPKQVRRVVPVAPGVFLGVGLLLALATGVVPWLAGEQFLTSAIWERSLPLIGKVKVTSALPFDVGVYLVVVGLVLAELRTLGEEQPA